MAASVRHLTVGLLVAGVRAPLRPAAPAADGGAALRAALVGRAGMARRVR